MNVRSKTGTKPCATAVAWKPTDHRTRRVILFVAGDEPNSRMARENLAAISDDAGENVVQTDVVDVLSDFDAAVRHHVLVTPTLIVIDPPPGATIIGNLNDRDAVRAALRLNGA